MELSFNRAPNVHDRLSLWAICQNPTGKGLEFGLQVDVTAHFEKPLLLPQFTF
jgi:hypothetical protein